MLSMLCWLFYLCLLILGGHSTKGAECKCGISSVTNACARDNFLGGGDELLTSRFFVLHSRLQVV